MVAARLPGRLRRFNRVRMAFAWASGDFAIKGILASWAASGSWDGANKEALIGIRGGLTSPSALARLMDAGFEVRVPMLTETLDSEYLNSSQLFHPKAICFDSGGGPFTLLIGSANLTDQGMGVEGKENFELASVLLGEPEDIPDNLDSFDSWWMSAWESAEILTKEALEAYDIERTRIKESKAGLEAEYRGAEVQDIIHDDSNEVSRNPAMMWIELPHVDLEIDPDGARSLSGGSKSQIDIPHEAALRFFGVSPEEHFSEEIELNYDSLTEWKKADFRGDLGLNHQLRLNLITQHKGGPNYENTVLVMEILSRNPTRIKYNVFPLGGPEHEELLILSEGHEELHETFGKTSRQWGFF